MNIEKGLTEMGNESVNCTYTVQDNVSGGIL
jgi:hypothetical protein